MSNLCSNCGASLQKDAKFCLDCGKPVVINTKEEKKSKFILAPPQRTIFLQKILPTLLAGSIIWLISEIIFSSIFIEIEFNEIFLIFYICMIITEAFIFSMLYVMSKNDKPFLGLFFFFMFSFIAGILSLPIVMITQFLPQVHMFVSLSFGAILITGFIGLILKENYFAEGYAWAHVILFIIGTVLVEIIFILVFDIHNFLLTIPVSLAYILIVSLTAMFYGSRAVQKNEKESWMLIFLKIEAILLLSLIIAIVIAVVVLIIIIIAILIEDSTIDLTSIFSFGGSGHSGKRRSRKRKRDQ